MTRYFSHIKLDAKTTDGNIAVALFNSENELIGNEVLRYITTEEIYEKIDRKAPINLDNTLIKGFSLTDYRIKRKLPEEQVVELHSFSAVNALFVSQAVIDFSFSSFIGKTIDFSQASFSSPQLFFSNSTFTAQCIDFESCFFANELVDMSYVKFISNTISFKNVVFAEGRKNFEHTCFENQKISFTNTDFNQGDISFSSSHFGDALINFRFARFGVGKISFYKCSFGKGEKNFEGAEFNDGEFNFRSANLGSGKFNMTRSKFGDGDKSFVHTTFGDSSVIFVNTNFGTGTVSFKLAEFGEGKKDFHFCSLHGDLIFERATMGKGNVDFRASDMRNGKISFTRFEMGAGGVDFDGASLQNMRILFKHSVIGTGDVNFNSIKAADSYILFENIKTNETALLFARAQVATISMRDCHLDHYLDLRVSRCKRIDLANTIVRDIIDLKPNDLPVRIDEIDLSGMRLIGKLFVDWDQNNIKKLIDSQHTSSSAKAEQFRLLKENFSAIGQYANEDHAYVEFKRHEAKALLESKSKRGPIWRPIAYLEYIFKWVLFDLMGLYATAPVRVLISMGTVFMLFTTSFVLLALTFNTGVVSSIGDPDQLTLFQRSLYHSAVTFLTIGYGDYYPSGIIRWLSSLEGFSGLFLMSYFTVAFVRKILR